MVLVSYWLSPLGLKESGLSLTWVISRTSRAVTWGPLAGEVVDAGV
jgi:hypothetical protein